MSDTLTSTLNTLLNQPTAPFHEYHVRGTIEALLKDVPNVTVSRDAFGNLLASYRKGNRQQKNVWVLGSHMDHPAFVVDPETDEMEFLGGVSKTLLEKTETLEQLKMQDGFATWDFGTAIAAGRVSAPACDDLVGCSVLVTLLKELARFDLDAEVHLAFTRAEEVGFLGAWHLGKNWPFGANAVYLSLETSRPVGGAEHGLGPIVRVGDRLSVFDNELTHQLVNTAMGQGIRIQRCLLDAGSCEASALQNCGVRSAAVSIPLGNYHNQSDEGELAAEWVYYDDVHATLNLLLALVGTEDAGLTQHNMAERVDLQMTKYGKYLKATEAQFA